MQSAFRVHSMLDELASKASGIGENRAGRFRGMILHALGYVYSTRIYVHIFLYEFYMHIRIRVDTYTHV